MNSLLKRPLWLFHRLIRNVGYVQRVIQNWNKRVELEHGKMSDMQFAERKEKVHLQQWIHL